MSAPHLPTGCTGDCENGQRDCTCGQAIGMWADERRRPRLYAAAYLAVLAGAVLLSHGCARGWL